MWFKNVNVGGLSMLVIEHTSPWVKYSEKNLWVRRDAKGYVTDVKSQQEIVDLIRAYEKREGYEFRVNGYTLNIVYEPKWVEIHIPRRNRVCKCCDCNDNETEVEKVNVITLAPQKGRRL